MFAIRLPNGQWWRRGTGTRPGGPTMSLRWATQYRNKGAAFSAATTANLDGAYGGYEIVETPRIVGDVVGSSNA